VPLQQSIPKNKNLSDAEFLIDKEYYASRDFMPGDIARLTESGVLRGRNLNILEIYPVQYLPSTGELKIMKKCKIKITFHGADFELTREKINRYTSPAFQKMFEKLILNHGDYKVRSNAKNGEGYLIIVYDDFYDEILPFANWKEMIGYEVTITNTSDIPGGPSKENIRNYIDNAYHNWSTPPSYVLLVGDTPQIPTWPGTTGPNAVDLYYVTVDGTDYFPDIHIGRFPAATEAHVAAMVNKTISYEARNFPSNDFIKKAAFMASEDNYQVSEGTHNYVINNYLLPNNYTCDKLYCHTYGATTQQVINALNDGRSLAVYSGHGSETSWADGPPLSQSDVRSLTNYGMYPFVCSHACLTGSFQVDECFGETWLREAEKAALAFWGASYYTYWDEDDVLEKKMFYAWWVDNIETIGGMTDQALLYLYQYYNGGGRTKYYFEAYNILGDPSVKIWRTLWEHDIAVENLDVDTYIPYGESVYVNATVINKGMNDESNILVNFTVNGSTIDSITINSLPVGQAEQVSFEWNPGVGTYLVTIEAEPVPNENDTTNNEANKTVHVVYSPDIWVNPENFDFYTETNSTDDKILVIGNDENSYENLTFNISTDSSWLYASPTNGMVPIGDSLNVTVTVNSTGLTQGVYHGNLIISTNDVNEPEVTVPVTLNVVYANDVGVISINYPSGTIPPGNYTINATIKNFGDRNQTNVTVNCTIMEGVLGTFLYEDFSAGVPPSGWSQEEAGEWDQSSTNYAGGTAPEARLYWSNINGDYAYLDSPALNTIGAPTLTLSFKHYISHYTSSFNCRVYARASTSDVWTDITPWSNPVSSDIGPETVTVDVTSFIGPETQIRFEFDGDNWNINDWYIDDVEIYSSSKAGGDTVYYSEITVDIPAYSSKYVEFPPWNATYGSYVIEISTLLDGDENNSNNATSCGVIVTFPPECKFTHPLDCSVVNGTVNITGTAYDADGEISSVWIKIGTGNWQKTIGNTSWYFEWNTVQYNNGFYDVYVKAKDDLGAVGMDRITVTVDNVGYYLQWSQTYAGRRYQGAQPIGDADNDGLNELLVGGTDAVLRVLEWNGNTYAEEAQITSGYGDNPGGFCIGDVDNDGENEIAVAWDYHFQAFEWNCSVGAYEQIGSTWMGHGTDNTYDCFIGDFDNDGENEIILSDDPSSGNPEITILKWNGNDFVEVASWNAPGDVITPMAWISDVDNDGENEIVCTPGQDLVVLEWTGSSFVSTVVDTFSYEAYGVTCGDANGNGIEEILVGLHAPTAYIYEWNGSAYEQIWSEYWSGEEDVIEAVYMGDTDGDGELEVCIGTGVVHILGWDDNEYVEEAILPTQGTLAKVAVGDCDNDGYNEINAADVLGSPNMESVYKYMGGNPPLCNIIHPSNGSTVSGIINITGEAFDLDDNLESVFVRINNGSWEAAERNGSSWWYEWNTTEMEDGIYTIYAGAFDGHRYSAIACTKVFVTHVITFNFTLFSGWNLITIPVENNLTAKSLIENITGCNVVYAWDAANDTYKIFTSNSPPSQDFRILPGVGYFIGISNDTSFSVNGAPLTEVSIHLYPGWNLIGWFKDETTASSILENITGCNVVYAWDAANDTYKIFTSNSPPSQDFVIKKGDGIFVSVELESIWHGEG